MCQCPCTKHMDGMKKESLHDCDSTLYKKAQLTPGKRATAVCVSRLLFAISTLFDAPQLRNNLRYQRNLYISGKYIQWATIPSLTIRVYRHSFSCYCLRNMINVAKFRENLTLQQFKVIDLCVNGKPICDFLFVTNYNFIRNLLPFSRYSHLKIENC